MRRLTAILLAFMILSPLVGFASASSFRGWVPLPGKVTAGDVTFEFRDVSFDGTLVGTVYSGDSQRDFSLHPGESVSENNVSLGFLRAIVGEKPILLLNASFPYVLQGETLVFGEYSIKLVSVGAKGAKVTVSRGDESKTFSSGTIKFGNLRVKVKAYPKIFAGYLKPGQDVTAAGRTLTFTNATIEKTSTGFVETLFFRYEGRTYSVTVGKEIDVGPFHVKALELVGVEYAKVEVFFRGASMEIQSVPDATFSLSPGQTRNVGPYVLHYDYNFDGSVGVSLRNSCGQVLASSRISAVPVAQALYHGGVTVALESVDGNGKATFNVFIDPSKVPDIKKVANLLITVDSSPGKKYVPQKVRIDVENTGTVALSNVILRFVPDRGFKLLSGGEISVPSLKPGVRRAFEVTVMPLRSGNVSLGKVIAKAVAPFELACGGYTILTFESNSPKIQVSPSKVSYSLKVSGNENVRLYHPLVINVSVTNTGDVALPANLTVGIPNGIAVEPNGVFEPSSAGLVAPLNLKPGDSVTMSLLLVPYSVGKRKVSVSIETIPGRVNGTVVVIDVPKPQENGTETVTVTVTETVPSNGTVTVTETRTETKESTVTETQSVPYTPLKSKALWTAVGVLIGALAIITLAWYQARRS
ncbi:hypothetical protein [Thermococcus sp. 21S7]|uniref:hypothetical protein n=1 Tax=Thermococcus sp. 21S7 TaxID=1638221 RepID=UPI00143C33AF|nr:hypothetical protein [Thermococcus sp. 21S7]NJE60318.1 hypothetical protein [Thermococcus sp. 21S7]